jgi:vacuolar-type H+-ATPase subunit F/Vma7
MYKIGVIGDRETVLGFRLSDLTHFSGDECRRGCAYSAQPKALEYAVLYIYRKAGRRLRRGH